jgi:hypothetical protein
MRFIPVMHKRGIMIRIECTGADSLPLDAIEEFQGNLKKRSKKDIELIITSIEKYGFSFPFFIWNGTGHNYCLDGHGRIQALSELRRKGEDLPMFPVVYVEAKDEAEAKNKLLRLNSQYGQMTIESVLEFTDGIDMQFEELVLSDGSSIDFIKDSDAEIDDTEHEKLSDVFLVPPFSVLDTRQGYWQERKEVWKKQIGDNGESREGALAFNKKSMVEIKSIGNKYDKEKVKPNSLSNGVSLLDPVLAEVAIKWFGLPCCNTFDCFAGDSVFGYVSTKCGNSFIGIELRQAQVDINNKRVTGMNGKYICDDGRNVLNHIDKESQDLLFSCPPYYDLEVYSDLENDASNQETYEDFFGILEMAFTNAVQCLRQNRFAFIVVGDIRDKNGNYRCFPDDIKRIFKKAGMELYNELILIEMLGTLPQRASKYMISRKVGKCHQNVLVFYKGRTEEIKNIFPKLEIEGVANESADVQL